LTFLFEDFSSLQGLKVKGLNGCGLVNSAKQVVGLCAAQKMNPPFEQAMEDR
jgi:hypothetical protein